MAMHWTMGDLDREHVALSECGRYRYALHRDIATGNDRSCLFIMLNPSTADGTRDDPTIRRCKSFAARLGCDHLYVANLFAFRTPHPSALMADGVGDGDIVGPDNRDWIDRLADVVTHRDRHAGPIICAWGNHGTYIRQDETVLGWLDDYHLWRLGRTGQGAPAHPLYLPSWAPLTIHKRARQPEVTL